MSYLGILLTKEAKVLYTEDHIMFLKDVKDTYREKDTCVNGLEDFRLLGC